MDVQAHDPNALSLPFVEALYAEYLRDPASVDGAWRRWFESQLDGAAGRTGPSFAARSIFHAASDSSVRSSGSRAQGAAEVAGVAALQDRVDQLVRAYRVRGHLLAHLDPLGLPRPPQPEVEPAFYGLGEEHMDLAFSGKTIYGPPCASLREIITRLENTYCRSIGVQFMHIDELGVKDWLQERMESTENRLELGRDEQLRILTKLTDAVIFEDFIQKKYLGAKRFSLEGGESLIPLLDLAIEKAGADGVDEIVLGMAHRGRLNVLANIIGKSPGEIFREFEDSEPERFRGRGDVKYHLGYSCDRKTRGGHSIHLSLCFNPSHLEFVNPVALGRMRAKQDRADDRERQRGMVLLIHGDAAFAGEGVVQETLNMSQLEGYTTGGTVHVIVNNQIGFTTRPGEARSSVYATSVAKMLASPIFHVNGEDPEAVAQVVDLAMDFRRTFRRDVVIDMYCYRRYGHNEGDEPAFTQPLLYSAIGRRKSVRQGYLEHMLELGGVTGEEAEEIKRRRQADLERELSSARDPGFQAPEVAPGVWEGYRGGGDADVPEVETGVARHRLAALLELLAMVPADFRPHRKIARLLEGRRAAANGERPLDWAAAEALAFASLATEGHSVRLSGQDSVRGTFSHRHASVFDVEDGRPFTPLQHLGADQAAVAIYNSPLSEVGVLGFDYGYSLDCPDGLVLWEAQFGDFNNAAQVIIDQFIVSAEDKWQRLSGLVLLLPHGFEGMGPEHSSARLERFLMMAADDNIQVVNPTTPAQYFHVLRRQVLRPWRKPLVVMTPKSLLRSPHATSNLDELSHGSFRRILFDERSEPGATSLVLLCSGKVYYDLATERERLERDDVAILRLEQLYPLTEASLLEALASYPGGTPVRWVQEEPENMGAWRYLRVHLGMEIGGRFPLAGVHRAASSSPATGSASSHRLEQAALLARAFE